VGVQELKDVRPWVKGFSTFAVSMKPLHAVAFLVVNEARALTK
jgi:hypothetical protein